MAGEVIHAKETAGGSPIAAVAVGLIFGLGGAIAALLIISAAAVFYDIPEHVMNILIILISAASMFAAGFKAAAKNQKNGLLIGAAAGLLYSAITLAAGLMFGSSVGFTPELIADLAIAAALGGLGGVAGINIAGRKSRKRKRK